MSPGESEQPAAASTSAAGDDLKETKPPSSDDDEDSKSDGESTGSAPALTKRERRRERKRLIWEQTKPARRERQKQNMKRRRAEALANGETLAPTRKALKKCTMEKSSCKLRVAAVVDMAYDELMSAKDRQQCVHQLAFCYGVNRRLPQPMQFYITNFDGPSRHIYDAVDGRSQWDVHVRPEPLDTVFAPADIVYLSSDSDNVLGALDHDKVYVIGGLVDHNQHKDECHRRAQQRGWQHARLPINEFVHMKTRQVLTVNQVFHILAAFTEKQDWKDAFFSVIPVRKGMKDKPAGENPKAASELHTTTEDTNTEVDSEKTQIEDVEGENEDETARKHLKTEDTTLLSTN